MSTGPREETLFSEALALPVAERAAFLADACAHDPALRARVEALLAAAAESRCVLDTSAAPRPAVVIEEKPGDVIGRYKLLQQIGEGGCGVVYMAEQQEPVVRRVALKVIKLGMDTKAVVARFEAERQALALMDHPNIAKVLDGGASATGRPYFVMELVRGIPITRFCDDRNLSAAERLSLFVPVCQAIQPRRRAPARTEVIGSHGWAPLGTWGPGVRCSEHGRRADSANVEGPDPVGTGCLKWIGGGASRGAVKLGPGAQHTRNAPPRPRACHSLPAVHQGKHGTRDPNATAVRSGR